MSDLRSAMAVFAALPFEDGRTLGEALDPWQLDLAYRVLDPQGPNVYATGPRGAAKGLIAGGTGVADLITLAPPMSRSYILAVDADQANIDLDSIRYFVRAAPQLGEHVDVQARRVVARKTGATLEVLAADEASAFGLRIRRVVCDEFAQWHRGARGLWIAVLSALPKTNGRAIVLTTAGTPDHFSHAVLEHARTSEQWVTVEIPGPLRWISAEHLAEQRALLTESQFAQLHLNQWVVGEDKLTTPEQVRACVAHSGPLEPVQGRSYVLGLDLGLVNDRTVLTVAHAERRDGRHVVVVDRQLVWQGSKERPVPLGEVEEAAFVASRQYGRAPLIADPYQAVMLCQHLRARGVSVREFTFSAGSVGRLALTLYRLLRDVGLDLDGDDEPLLTELTRVKLVESSPGAYRIDHGSGEHDDRVISLALAAQALAERDDTPVRLSLPSQPVRRPPIVRTPPSQRSGTRMVGPFRVPIAGYKPPEREGYR